MKSKLSSGMIVATTAGNYIYRLLAPCELKPGWAINIKSVKYSGEMWHVDVLFDASGKISGHTVTDVKNLIPFDAKQLGLLWTNIVQLTENCRRTWNDDGTKKEGQQEQT